LLFQNIFPQRWLNIALAAAFAFNIIFIGLLLINGNICQSFAGDYCAYWGAGRIINELDFSDIYDLDVLTEYEKEIYPYGQDSSFEPFAVMYPPIFMLPFQLLSLINLPLSFLIWTLINGIGFILYLQFFSKEVTGHPLPPQLLLMILLSLPVILNFKEGQVNVWLFICSGEFLRAMLSDKPTKAGVWLGGLLLKPQLLILIIPFLLFQRSIKSIKGFIYSSTTILAISFVLINVDGILKLENVILESFRGGVASCPQAMMNWRMLGLQLAFFTTSDIGWVTTIIGCLLTTIFTLFIFRKKIMPDSISFAVACLGIFAATGAVTWHAHLHTSMILIPPMLYLIFNNRFNKKLFKAWVFIPILFLMVGYILAITIALEGLPINIYQVVDLSIGLPGFILNLTTLGWAVVEFSGTRNERPEEITIVNDHKFE